MRKQWQGFLAGILIASIAFGMGSPAVAALVGKTIEVYTGVDIYVDDVKLDPRDANGNPVEVFVYNGTTYLPVRAVGEAVGKVVQWEGKTSSVYLGKHTGQAPAVWVKDLDPFTGRAWSSYNGKDNTGIQRSDAAAGRLENTYLINGQYSAISGTLFQTYDKKSSTGVSPLEIYGDGKLLYRAEVKGGIQPVDFYVDISGVLELKIVFDGEGMSSWGTSVDCAAIADFGLWT